MLLTLKNRLAEVTHSQREERPAKINPWFANFLAQKLLEKEPQVSWELWHFKRQAPPDDLGSAEARVSLEEAEGHLFLSLTILLWAKPEGWLLLLKTPGSSQLQIRGSVRGNLLLKYTWERETHKGPRRAQDTCLFPELD